MTQPARGEIRNFLSIYFNDNQLTNLCFDYFPLVANNFTNGMEKDQKVRLLIEYCENQGKLKDLLAAVERERPVHFRRIFNEGLSHVSPIASSGKKKSFLRVREKIFLGYSIHDAELAQGITSALRQNGWNVWIAPESIRPGEKWAEAIDRGLLESGFFLLLITKSAVESDWVRQETYAAIEMANKGEVRFLPLQVELVTIPPLWRSFQSIRFSTLNDANIEKLLLALRRLQKTNAKPIRSRNQVDVTKSETQKTIQLIPTIDRPKIPITIADQTIKIPDQKVKDGKRSVFLTLLILATLFTSLIAFFIFLIVGPLTGVLEESRFQIEGIPDIFAEIHIPKGDEKNEPLPNWEVKNEENTSSPRDPDQDRSNFDKATRLSPIVETPQLGVTEYVNPRFIPPSVTLGHEWIEIPAGPFVMGLNPPAFMQPRNNKRKHVPHEVLLETYWIAKFETTNAQYKAFIDDENWNHLPNYGDPKPEDCKWDESGNFLPGYENHPVVCVTWHDALAYAIWVSEKSGHNIVLPSEQEWEKAARGPMGNMFPWGNDIHNKKFNFCDLSCAEPWADKSRNDGFMKTSPVGSFQDDTSHYGVMDMAGNAWEWTSSTWDTYKEDVNSIGTGSDLPNREEQAKPTGIFRVIRGGAFNSEKEALPQLRGRGNPADRGSEGGFRIVLRSDSLEN